MADDGADQGSACARVHSNDARVGVVRPLLRRPLPSLPQVDKFKVLASSLANSSSKAEKRILDHRRQKEEALTFRAKKENEVSAVEKVYPMEAMEIGEDFDEVYPTTILSRTSMPVLKDDSSLIVIPYAHIFDLMLKALNLPPATYHHKICPCGTFRVTVTFHASPELLDGLLVPSSISGVLSYDYEEAEDSAAIEAIRYMENAYSKEIRDYHYTHVKKLEHQIQFLVKWLFGANETIKKLRKGWYYALRYISSYSDKIQNVTGARNLQGQDGTKGVMKAALASIEGLVHRLCYIGMKLEQRLQTTKDSF